MQFDWTTFALEILNFLVLLWILKRFLYRPVLDVLDARQQAIHDQDAKAKRVQEEADALKEQYEARLNAWQEEREQARRKLDQEMAKERESAMELLKKQLADEREKTKAREQASDAASEAAALRMATEKAYRRATAMLERLASPEMTAHIVAMVEEDLRALPDEKRSALRDAAANLSPDETAEVASAHCLNENDRQRIAQALSGAAGINVPLNFVEKPELTAGLRISVGACLLQANLADELSFFREQGAHV